MGHGGRHQRHLTIQNCLQIISTFCQFVNGECKRGDKMEGPEGRPISSCDMCEKLLISEVFVVCFFVSSLEGAQRLVTCLIRP